MLTYHNYFNYTSILKATYGQYHIAYLWSDRTPYKWAMYGTYREYIMGSKGN